jgi:hypothetical protein
VRGSVEGTDSGVPSRSQWWKGSRQPWCLRTVCTRWISVRHKTRQALGCQREDVDVEQVTDDGVRTARSCSQHGGCREIHIKRTPGKYLIRCLGFEFGEIGRIQKGFT